MKNSIDTIGNRTRDLPVCSAVPHPTFRIHRHDIYGAHLFLIDRNHIVSVVMSHEFKYCEINVLAEFYIAWIKYPH